MQHFDFPGRFVALHERAAAQYAQGRGLDGFFSADDAAWLAANGITTQHMYDYAEDFNKYAGEPGVHQALAIELVRRDYFLNVQDGKPSGTKLDPATLPGKTDAIRGIAWLPRLLIKARAKLRGELPDSLMFCCGGDRNFFKDHDIVPAEFLSVLWRNEGNDAAVVDWVVKRRNRHP